MPPTVVREAEATLTFGVAPGTVVDLSCDQFALEIGSETETIDLATFCNPTATDLGRTTYTAVASLLWSPQLYTKLSPHVGASAKLAFIPDPANAPTGKISFDTRFGALPWGRFEVGQRVEVDLPLAVLSEPIYTP